MIEEWIHPSQTTTQIWERNIQGIDFPIIFKICPNPASNVSLIRKEGYRDGFSYFRGESKLNKPIYGWAGHTNTSDKRDTVGNGKLFWKLSKLPLISTTTQPKYNWSDVIIG